MKILRGCLLACLALFALAPPLAAANPWQNESLGLSILRSELPPCTSGGHADNRAFTVRDCVSSTSCASGGTATVRWVCDSGTYRALNVGAAVDLSGYALLAGDADGQTIQGVTGSNMPRLMLLDTSLSLLGAGAAPPLLYFLNGSVALKTYNGSVQEMSLTIDPNSISFNADGLSGVFQVREGAVRLGLPLTILSGASPPTCNSTLVSGPEAKALYIDTTTGAGTLCSCNGTSWSVIAPAGGDCS